MITKLKTSATIKKKRTNKVLEDFLDFINDKSLNKDESIDRIIYGFSISIYESNEKRKYVFFIDDKDNRTIKYIPKDNSKQIRKIEFNKITQVEFGCARGGFSNVKNSDKKNFDNDLCLSIFCGSINLDMIFDTKDDIVQFCYAIAFLWKNENIAEAALGQKFANIKQIWNKYDDDHSGKMDLKEFLELAKEIRLIGNMNDLKQLFLKIDSDNSGKIDFEEFCKYFEELSSAKEFEDDFRKYAGSKDHLDPFDLNKFITEVQKDKLSFGEICMLVIEFNKDIPRDTYDELEQKLELNLDKIEKDYYDIWNPFEKGFLKLNLENFQGMMINSNFNNSLRFKETTLDYPLYDYFVYSSHNTYLKGHQLYGESSVEMYAYAINLGCRCVELDCWDGSNNEPKITHGMTFTSDILFKDVLKNIKDNAFKKTKTPFFLSIEMHCSEDQQKVMAGYFRTILEKCWTPEAHGNPIYFPPPSDLSETFIVKCKKPRVFREKEPSRNEKFKVIVKENVQKKENLKHHIEDHHENHQTNKIADIKNDRRISKKDTLKDTDIQVKIQEKDEKKLKDELKKSKKQAIKEVVPDLYDVIGLISVGFEVDKLAEKKYQPWDVISLSESKINSFINTHKEKLIQYSSGSFLRVYPKGSRVDSSNFDPVKSWIVGGQLVSLNLQSLKNDYTLLNHVFFKNNNECGYILKPEFLRIGSIENRLYVNPVINLNFQVLSGLMIQKCLTEESHEIYVEVSVIGSAQDDKNPVVRTNTISQNLIHPIFDGKFDFKIYEPELSFILIKLFDQNESVLARSVLPLDNLLEGYRNVTLYDDSCDEIDSSMLIIYTKRNFL